MRFSRRHLIGMLLAGRRRGALSSCASKSTDARRQAEDRHHRLDAQQSLVRRARRHRQGPCRGTRLRGHGVRLRKRHGQGNGAFRKHHRRRLRGDPVQSDRRRRLDRQRPPGERRGRSRVLHRPRDQRQRRGHVADSLRQLLRLRRAGPEFRRNRRRRRGVRRAAGARGRQQHAQPLRGISQRRRPLPGPEDGRPAERRLRPRQGARSDGVDPAGPARTSTPCSAPTTRWRWARTRRSSPPARTTR